MHPTIVFQYEKTPCKLPQLLHKNIPPSLNQICPQRAPPSDAASSLMIKKRFAIQKMSPPLQESHAPRIPDTRVIFVLTHSEVLRESVERVNVLRS
ncbi:hypothetical protein CEXT_646501 [Caerostris extrusa]|uniref:Uncharacterized protein n=1 Tax=Caerostris extrusa TaxID=172846 RepID=A0AAV4MAV3_CAEEX|nr:hypothetical protein CEXT_646501 [Caerostris extrusa]